MLALGLVVGDAAAGNAELIGELRGAFGIHIATLAVAHGLDVEGDLASILPAAGT
jgi:hypothetical protein